MQTRFLRHVCSWMFGLSALAILALMAVAFADVMMRSFVRPLSGAFELTEVLVGVMVFAALPFVTLSGKHVKVSLLRSLVGKNVLVARPASRRHHGKSKHEIVIENPVEHVQAVTHAAG